MITIQKLVQNLMQCRDSNLVLPKLNDIEENPFVQKTAIELRRMELENVEEVFTQLNESNFTMDKELEELNQKLAGSSTSTITSTSSFTTSTAISPDALIIYVENETTPLPEVILNLLRAAGNSQDEWYIYGVKNPESFYKSFLLLTQLDFIIKNKTEKKNEVATFKREMALHYETFYKTLEYRNLRLPHHDMIHKLTSMDNYCGYDAVRFLCDYCQVNIILLDIIDRKYLDVQYTPNTLVPSVVKKPHTAIEFIIIIKYAAETYLPLMNSSGTHIFTQVALDWISRNYERLKVEKFKEPRELIKDAKDANGEQHSITEEYENTALGDANELSLADIEEPLEVDATGNFLDSKTVSVFFNNTIPPLNKQVNLTPIIKAGELSMAIEDMIEISDDLEEPSPEPAPGYEPYVPVKKQDPFQTMLDNIPSKPSLSSKTKTYIKERHELLESPKSTTNGKEQAKTTTAPAQAPTEEELKPIKSYNLLDLQMLARLHKIDTQKDGKAGKKVNKTKEEMYSEIKEQLDK
jgi:hypothetical protein